MGRRNTALSDVAQQPTLQEFLQLYMTADIRQEPTAQAWAFQLLREGTFQERWRLVKVFAKLGPTAIAPLLTIAEDHTAETELRWFAIRILGQYQDPEAIARLILLIDHCSEEFLLEEIIRTLVQLEGKAVDYLVPLLAKPESRSLAVKALCKLRYPQIIDPLLTVIDDPDPQIRCLAIETLSQFRQPQIFTALLSALTDTVAQVRREAVKGLGFWGQSVDPVVLCEKVQPLLYDFNLEVCAQAGFTLSRFPIPQAAKAIATVLQSPHTPEPLQCSLIQALGWLAIPESLTQLESLLYHEADTIVLETLKALGRITEPSLRGQGTAILLQFWQKVSQPQPLPIQQAFVYALGQLQDLRAQTLLTAFSQSPEKPIQLHAIAALKKIGSATSSELG
ncbi:PBS lyase [Picosynechococcus sp. PCC 7003]|uniref:HEAT repeat domain-containing protein n=1 Tax=Picosynechococcus sp. PCC 7003 TaxID=374981 RepID=UPI000810AD53|nr:HEAT repeat domain-containing protein [Picosynechococcus sp. PCC 7003]ANV84306.1 PBS lyase [Picosynechococcus sp. PCC 7003]